MSDKPIIFYVDDEPHNLTVFEAALPEEWEIKTFDNPMKALKALENFSPCVVVSDQRMPGVTGVEYLEMAKKLHPDAVRIIVTGYSDEDLVIESVRKAQVFDYIRKPWDVDELEKSLRRAITFYQVEREKNRLSSEVEEKQRELESRNQELTKAMQALDQSVKREEDMRKELECWVPPFVLWAIRDKKLQFPIKKDLVGITFDIVGSSKIHGIEMKGQSLRSRVIQTFSEIIIRNGGWRESHSGDSAYGHFGVLEDDSNPYESAMAVAREFRVALKGLCDRYSVSVECGIAIHQCKDCTVDIHQAQLATPTGVVVQKSFDTSSPDIDLLHRIEKLVHKLPGSNVILSEECVRQIKSPPPNLVALGEVMPPGGHRSVKLFLIPSDLATPEKIKLFKQELAAGKQSAPIEAEFKKAA